MKSSKINDSVFYALAATSSSGYIISDQECLAPSERCFDISFQLLANHEKLLNLLELIYIDNGYMFGGAVWTVERRRNWFANYLSAFSATRIEKDKRYEKLIIDDKIVRICIHNNPEKLKKAKEILEPLCQRYPKYALWLTSLPKQQTEKDLCTFSKIQSVSKKT